jgi:arylsulfatase A-like enzyme
MTAWRALLSVALFAAFAPAANAADQPNVVLIVADDQGWTDFGFMGHPVIKTPHLDRLAAESAVFPNGYVPTYYAMCEWLDETCGELLAYLDRKGLRERTLVAFVVDNGWIQETGTARTTRGNFALKSKLSPYDGGVRTPILLRWPGHTRPGRYEDLVSTIDSANLKGEPCWST